MKSLDAIGRWSTLGIALSAAFWAGSAWASRQHLDEAHSSVTHALQSLKAAGAEGERVAPHVDKAVALLTRAQSEILKAKQASVKPPQE